VNVSQQGQQSPQRKTQQRSLRTKQKLLDAALEAFSEGGFKGTSTRDIAARAGVHHPLITYHFSNKDRLWRSAVKYVFQDFVLELQKAQEVHAGECPKSRFTAMVRIYVRYAAKHPALHKIVLQESAHQSPRLEWLSENFLNPLANGAARYIVELQEKNVIPPGDPLIIYNMIRVSSGTLIALGLELKSTSNIDLEDPENLEALADLIVRVFLPGELAED
jgi:TetR/AcrR family transcriptional regulator